MMITEGSCWKCNEPMKIAFYQKASSTFGPGTFNEHELALARSKGVIIKEQYSKLTNERYLANTCRKCGNFIGDHYLFINYAAPHIVRIYLQKSMKPAFIVINV
ncbi:hypothetical protein A3860_38815 [Niastella vici]|uniref:Uncharacterized protein n=1 Tax=Niastella vici TaxID=1703345 RepID=A0A1V9FL93_9BACT|nr:hypothetical protein A3860_38815 [Niastella vici]